ncbi:MAG: LLM class flavin-dependent oxidoreductase [Herpetosiphonaceae bacterium]|nr:LLM class flavin-dependent oxidoreductase [Herpetosiphonaceae bacterium]
MDSVGFWDHYHSEQPAWGYVCGWSAYGALASMTTRIHLLPMVICRLNYTPGVLAKETSMLSIISGQSMCRSFCMSWRTA